MTMTHSKLEILLSQPRSWLSQLSDLSLSEHSWDSIFVCLFVCFLGPYLQHMEVPRLDVESELQLPAYTTATKMQDPI